MAQRQIQPIKLAPLSPTAKHAKLMIPRKQVKC